MAVGLVERTVHVTVRQVGKSGPQLREEGVQVLHVDVVPKAAIARQEVLVIVRVNTNAIGVPLHEGVVTPLECDGEAETIAKEGDGRL